MTGRKPNLEAAYALQTPDDNRALYADWARSYDTDFARRLNYQLPAHVARLFIELNAGNSPVLDVGAGTGLVADHLAGKFSGEIDALDISPEMLASARAKGLYRATIVADLTRPLDIASSTYRAIVSSGTFTHGHVGPDALDELLRIAAPDALFVLSVNARHFHTGGFEAKFAALGAALRNYALHKVANYGGSSHESDEHGAGYVVTFQKLDRL